MTSPNKTGLNKTVLNLAATLGGTTLVALVAITTLAPIFRIF